MSDYDADTEGLRSFRKGVGAVPEGEPPAWLIQRIAASANTRQIRALAREWAEQATDYDDDTEQQIVARWAALVARCRAKREAGATEGLEGAEKGSGDATLGAARLVRAWATDHGEQRLYHVSPPMGWGRDYVVVSAIEQPAETLIFTGDNDEADPITDLEELPGSLRGVCDHEAALRAAGYIVSSGDAT